MQGYIETVIINSLKIYFLQCFSDKSRDFRIKNTTSREFQQLIWQQEKESKRTLLRLSSLGSLKRWPLVLVRPTLLKLKKKTLKSISMMLCRMLNTVIKSVCLRWRPRLAQSHVHWSYTWMGDSQGRPSAVNLCPFIGVDLNLWSTV